MKKDKYYLIDSNGKKVNNKLYDNIVMYGNIIALTVGKKTEVLDGKLERILPPAERLIEFVYDYGNTTAIQVHDLKTDNIIFSSRHAKMAPSIKHPWQHSQSDLGIWHR